jgi:hypothetical protein
VETFWVLLNSEPWVMRRVEDFEIKQILVSLSANFDSCWILV